MRSLKWTYGKVALGLALSGKEKAVSLFSAELGSSSVYLPRRRGVPCVLKSECPSEGRVGSHSRSIKGTSELASYTGEFAIQWVWEVKSKWTHLLRI